MWHQVGFLADAFQIFKEQGMSVDLISTSETNVTVSLDPTANTLDPAALERLSAALGELCRVEILGPCASLSLLGHNIRGILHELGSAFELFQDHKIYLVSQAANDLNFTFVIDESQGDRLVQQLHERLISEHRLGQGARAHVAAALCAAGQRRAGRLNWWEESSKRRQLLDIAARESAAFVYDLPSIDATAAALRNVKSIARWAYAMKANWHPAILRRVYAAGLSLECVSQGELEHAFAHVPGLMADRVLFTPNFAPRAEYEFGFDRGVRVTLDNLYPLKAWPEVFRRPRHFRAYRSRHGPRAPPPCAHRRRALEIRRASVGDGGACERCARRRRAGRWTARAHRQRHFGRCQLDRDGRLARAARATISPMSTSSTWAAASAFPSSSDKAASI